jgi:hypothetical protein
MALQRIWIPSPCYHGGSSKRLIVLHTAEGARTIEDLGHFFQNYNNQVSSHTGADDKRGKIGEYVSRGNSSWTCANYNNVSVQMELCGFASWSTNEWKNNHHNMLANCADWIREESQKLGIPITKLSASQAQGSGRGVCQHRDLGAGGGGHTDCGNGFPMDYVLDLARGKAPAAKVIAEEQTMKVDFGSDHTAGIPMPTGAKKLRAACSQGGTMVVRWMGSGQSKRFTLEAEHRIDYEIPSNNSGHVQIVDEGLNGPLYVTFLT